MRLKTKFQDEDFGLGEAVEGVIVECLGKHEEELRVIATAAKGGQHTFCYSSIKKFMDDWEDVPEGPKEYWFIDFNGEIKEFEVLGFEWQGWMKAIGNYFSSREEAALALRKLKAWKRLKDKGFEFCCDIKYESLCGNGFNIPLNAIMPPEAYTDTEVSKDLELLFCTEVKDEQCN